MKTMKSYVEPLKLSDYPYTQTIEDRYLDLPNGISLRTVTFYPKQKSSYPPIVMMTGLVSVMQSSKEIVKNLNRDFVIHYLETREKSSSITNGHKNFSVVELGRDIMKMSTIIKNCTFMDLENHKRTHSDELAGIIKKFMYTQLQAS